MIMGDEIFGTPGNPVTTMEGARNILLRALVDTPDWFTVAVG